LYNIRLRNNSATGNGPLMLYGAGLIPEPEWEKYTTGSWWLPGFSVQSGGGSPGSGPDYPASGTKKSSLITTSTTKWKHYTWVIKPERMLLYFRNTDQAATADQLIFFMQIPKNISSTYVVNEINAAHGTTITTPPPNYNWFGEANAVRFYWRGLQNSYLTNVKISVQPIGTLSQPLLYLNVQQQQNGHALQFTDYAYNSASYYNIEGSTNGSNFIVLSKINAVTNRLTYNYEQMTTSAARYFYRIKRLAKDGGFSYSDIVSTANKTTKQIFEGISADGNMLYCNTAEKNMLIQIVSIGGQVYQSTLAKAVTDISTLPKGSYVVIITQNGSVYETHKIIK
jgi:hypothetical protein